MILGPFQGRNWRRLGGFRIIKNVAIMKSLPFVKFGIVLTSNLLFAVKTSNLDNRSYVSTTKIVEI